MSDRKYYLAVDLGAESGRVISGVLSSGKLELEEVHRFPNGAVEENNALHWDFRHLFSNIKEGISKGVKQADGEITGIAVDTWGVDYGLLDENDELIENPYHYRDSRIDGVMEKAFETMSKRRIYEHTGLQFLPFNTIYQLLASGNSGDKSLEKASKLLFTADLISFLLCGEKYAEYTLASTSQLMDMRKGEWSKEIFDAFGLKQSLVPEIVPPGTKAGKLKKEIADELGCPQIPVIASASHDTAAAVAAVPAGKSSRWAYLSSGTWSLMGIETKHAIINDKTFACEFTNEGGVNGTIRLLKNIMGLWLLQECRRDWKEKGEDYDYSQLTEMAKKGEPFRAYIDPDYPPFLKPGNMPEKINTFLKEKGCSPIQDKGQMVRAILESLAIKYRMVLESLEEITGDSIDCLHVVGGGIKNELLCRFTADALNRKVVTGPAEATATGNICTQAIATGQINSLQQARHIVRDSFELKTYEPENTESWENFYNKIKDKS